MVTEKPFTMYFLDNDLNDERHWQRVWYDEGEFRGRFGVANLWDCPEDACIGRALFDGNDYIEAVRLGMRLAQAGYTSIKVEEVKPEDDDDW